MIIGINQFERYSNYNVYFQKYGKCIRIAHEFRPDIDLLILTGGADVDPKRYGRERQKECGRPDLWKEHFDTKFLPKYIKAKIPIFGICRGHQTLAVHHGYPLIQHVVHPMFNLVEGEFGYNLVNSYHHQVVESVDNRAEIIATDSEEGTIEAIRYKNIKVASVQWHPELMGSVDEITPKLINWLLEKT